MSFKINFIPAKELKEKPSTDSLEFGKLFTDYMFVMDYEEGKGWHNPTIMPYGPIPMEPSAMVYHYGQAVFEGLKAYKTDDKKVLLFRPDANMKRINISNDRLCIPQIDVDDAVEAVKELVKLEKDWIPEAEGTSLYIRPFIIATDPQLGVHPSHTYKFIIVLSPVGAYYKEGINPVRIYVETNYVRAVKGGLGFAKTPGNYAASLKAQVESQKLGYTQVLWLDGVEKKYIEEVGTMNVFFVINNQIITPELNGSILAGITRDSSIKLLKSWGMDIVERKISIDEVIEASKNGTLNEAFGTGTAAVISPIGELNCFGEHIPLNNGKIGTISQKLYDTMTGIQYGHIEDTLGWTLEVK